MGAVVDPNQIKSSVLRTVKAKRVSFRHKLQLVLFAGEERGLVGSRAYSNETCLSAFSTACSP